MASVTAAAGDMAKMFAGDLVLPGDPAYDQARRVHNGAIDKRPAIIARCRGIADIADAVTLARESGLEIAVRGGGHNVAGRCASDGGVMIDLSPMRWVTVDPVKRIAWAGGGATWRDFNRETQLFGLATTGGVVSSTGVAGLTLGGGFGWLMPRFGMALDNLRAARLVLADGTTEWVNAEQHPDLFWAIRGGGGNFGIAGFFEFQLHEVGPIVTGGLVVHPGARARDMLRFFREQTRDEPEEAFLVAALLTAPDGSSKVAAIAAQHSGSLAAGEKFAAPIKQFGPPIMDVLGPMPYTASNMMLDDAFKPGSRNYWKSHFLPELTDGAIDALVDQLGTLPTPQSQIVIEHFHGAGTRVPVGDTAYALRQEGYNVLIVAQWLEPSDDERCIEWCRQAYASLAPYIGARRYVNYLGEDDLCQPGSAEAVYGPNLPRLRQVKRRYDPQNVFRQNLNIAPLE